MNLYQAFGGNPVNFVDPWGENKLTFKQATNLRKWASFFKVWGNHLKALNKKKHFIKVGWKYANIGVILFNVGKRLQNMIDDKLVLKGTPKDGMMWGETGSGSALKEGWNLDPKSLDGFFKIHIILNTTMLEGKNCGVEAWETLAPRKNPFWFIKLLSTFFHEGLHAKGFPLPKHFTVNPIVAKFLLVLKEHLQATTNSKTGRVEKTSSNSKWIVFAFGGAATKDLVKTINVVLRKHKETFMEESGVQTSVDAINNWFLDTLRRTGIDKDRMIKPTTARERRFHRIYMRKINKLRNAWGEKVPLTFNAGRLGVEVEWSLGNPFKKIDSGQKGQGRILFKKSKKDLIIALIC